MWSPRSIANNIAWVSIDNLDGSTRSKHSLAMELHQIRYFLAVFETRNFTRAAERCNVSQPALTKAIKKLEAELDGPLFHRDRSGAKLTTLGEMVLPKCRRLFEDSSSISRIAGNHAHLRKVPLRIGVLQTIGPTRLAAYFQVFHNEAPEVELEVRILTHEQLVNGLEDATIEVAITNVDVVEKDWAVVKKMYQEAYVVALPTEHVLAEKEEVALIELDGQPYIDRLACELRESVAKVCEEKGFELYASYRTENESWIECLVAAGVGVALMPEHSLMSADTVRRPLVDPEVSRTISMVRCVDHPLSPAAKLLWRMWDA